MLSQELNVRCQVLGLAGKQSWWLVSCKWKVVLAGEKRPQAWGAPPGFWVENKLPAAGAHIKTHWRAAPLGL